MAGRIPQSFIDTLVDRADIVEIVQSHVPLKRSGREWKACCPFHDEKTPSFYVSPTKQFFHCFGCGAHGTVIGFLMDYERLEFVDAVEELASRYGLEVPREGGAAAPDDAARGRADAALDMLAKANAWFKRQLREHPRAADATAYLKRRGMSGRTAAAFEIGFAPPGWDNLLEALGTDAESREALHEAGLLAERGGDDDQPHDTARRRYDRFRDRMTFPIHDRRGRVVGFGARSLGDETPKYLNSPETVVFHKGRELYGFHRLLKRRPRPQRALFVEGYMDVVMLAEHGVDYACATLGTAATGDQIERLLRAVPDVVFCFDGDDAGRRAAWRALENALPFLRDGREASFLFLPEGDDPDSYVGAHGREAFEALIDDAPSLTTFLFQELRRDVDLRSPEGRARLVERARPLIERLPDGALRTLATQSLSQLIGLSLERTEAELRGHRAAAGRAASGARAAPAPPRREPPSTPRVPKAVARAITLLVHHPRLAAEAGNVRDLALLDTPGADLIADVVETLKDRPDVSTGWIVEHFREHPLARGLQRVAGLEAPAWNDALVTELADCLEMVRLAPREARFEELLRRSREAPLSDEERREFAALARARGGPGRGS